MKAKINNIINRSFSTRELKLLNKMRDEGKSWDSIALEMEKINNQ